MRDGQQGRDAVISNENNVTSITTVATVWSSLGDKLLATETHTSITALAASYKDSGSID
jgi:hypothetical protein